MSRLSRSPQRHTFHRDRAFERAMNGGTIVTDEALRDYDLYENWRLEDEETEQDPRFAENNLEYDLRTTEWILEKVRASDRYAQNLYAALCNNDFQKNEVWPILKDEIWHCSWRFAGGIIADMRQSGDYNDWYCTGTWMAVIDDPDSGGRVSEGLVTDEVKQDLWTLGWVVVNDR